jgi:hypothetical protein
VSLRKEVRELLREEPQGWRVTGPSTTDREGTGIHGSALDLITVVFLGRYRNPPLHLFGGIGSPCRLPGSRSRPT